MKRYWAVGAFAVFIVAAIGTFYIQVSMNRLPEFRLERLEGDPAEAANLLLKADYREDRYNRYTDRIDIYAAGSSYDAELRHSALISVGRPIAYPSSSLNRLIREHKDFMRGNRSGDYYEDDASVIHADVRSESSGTPANKKFRFQIDLLDKKTNRSQTLSVPVTAAQPSSDMRVEDVQRSGSELKIAVVVEPEPSASAAGDASRRTELHVFALNLSDSKVTGDQTVPLENDRQPGTSIQWSQVSESASVGPNDFFVYNVSSWEDPNQTTAGGGQFATPADVVRKERFAVYRYSTGRTQFISLPDSNGSGGNAGRTNTLTYQDGDYAVWATQTESEIRFKRYRLADGGLVNEQRLTKRELRADSILQLQYGVNRIYLLLMQEGKQLLWR